MKDKLIKIYNKVTDKTKVFSYCSVKEFCQENGYTYKKLADEREGEELRPYIWKQRENAEKRVRSLPETYLAEIKNAVVFGGNELVACGTTILSDMITNEYADKMRFTKEIVKSANLEIHEITLSYHNYRALPIEKAFYLVGLFSNSYYHFMVDILPKLYYLYQNEEYKDYPLLIDKEAYRNFQPIIDMYNIDKRKVICISHGVAYKVKNLLMTSNCAWYDRYVLEKNYPVVGHVYDKEAMQFVRNKALSMIEPKEKMEKVFVSRRKMDEHRRRLVHDEQIEELFHEYGFISVFPEDLSFMEQVQLFSHTKVLAGATGAAFTNLIFLPEDATVICCTCVKGNSGENLFPSLWNTVGNGKFYILQGNVTEETKEMKDNLRKFELDKKDLVELLETL
ncbi:MAG: glycosyltransferase family 61 protein [Lachnospiraceae bacterium]|nr:glycosyltransferase family 61 protein [Lachnospiraceae bacterium]